MAIAGGGQIIMKMNSLVDPGMIDHLYAASQAGVSVDLIVRGICCLRPGVPGLSDNIRVRSLIGRYLEHSRILHFANGAGPAEPLTYIGSADLMPRNLDRRVEALVPVVDPAIARRVHEILEVVLADDTLAWTLGPDAVWRRISDAGRGGTVDAHLRFQDLASARATRLPIEG
jgi:polyphosphate kinase